MIVIPTYKRYNIKTIDFLLREGYTPDDITIFVANKEFRPNEKNQLELLIKVGPAHFTTLKHFYVAMKSSSISKK